MFEYQIVSVSVDETISLGMRKDTGWVGRSIDSLEKIVKEEVKKGWRPIGGISWSPIEEYNETDGSSMNRKAHVSQAMEKESKIPGSKIVRKTRH